MNTRKIEDITNFLVTGLITTTDLNTNAAKIENKKPNIFRFIKRTNKITKKETTALNCSKRLKLK